MKSPNHALQRTGSAVTLAAQTTSLRSPLATFPQPARPLRLSLSLGSFGDSHALSMNRTFLVSFVASALLATFASAEPSLPRLQPTNTPKPFTAQEREYFGGGCSWYCGAPGVRATATSALEERNGLKHPAEQAHDFKLQTVWSEGAAEFGAGERLSFEFITTKQSTTNLAVTSCAIAAGHQATEKLFRQNARPKTLQLFIDGRAVALLELKDSMGFQRFTLPKVRLERPSRHTIAFQILDAYPGSKFQDTCITEIHFDGEGDMH